MKVSLEQPHMQLAILSRGYVVSRAIHAIASLNVADHMSDELTSIDTLASQTATQPELLNRLLGFLSDYGLFIKKGDHYALTDLSKPLREDDPHSIKAVLSMVDEAWWQAFTHLDKGLRTGIPPFNHQHGSNFFDFLSQHPEKQANFDRGMAKLSTYDNDAIASAYDFGQFSDLIDVGAGRGGLCKAIAKRFPDLKITLFDSESVIHHLSPNDYPKNIQLQSGDFFSQIPVNQAYLFKGVLHDFNDESVKKILGACLKSMPKNASLLIAEQIIPETNAPHPNKTMDIVMMVLLGGRQRSLSGWQNLVESLGFRFTNSYPTESIFSILEFKPGHL